MATKEERAALLKAIEEDSADVLAEADDSLKSDRDFIVAAVKQGGWALEYADASLKADREVVLVAVKQDGRALKFADDSLKADREVVLVAVKSQFQHT